MPLDRQNHPVHHLFTLAFFISVCINAGLLLIPQHVYSYQEERATFNWGELQERIQNLNPLKRSTNEERSIHRLIYGDPLYYYNPYDVQINNGIIERESLFPNLNRWILVIKSNIFFHDGSRLRSDDIKFSIELYKEYVSRNNLSYNLQLDKIKEIMIQGDSAFEIELSEQVENFRLMLADIPVLSQEYYRGETYEQTIENLANKRPFGYGPFMISNFIPGNRIVLVRHFNYFGGAPEFEQINILLYSSSDQIKSDFITGDLDFIQINSVNDKKEVSRADTTFRIVQVPTQYMKMYTITLNGSDPILSAENVRKLVNMLYNKNRYPLSSPQYDVRSKAFGPLPETSLAFFDDLNKQNWNPVAARRDLDRLGWKVSDSDGILGRNERKFIMELIYPERDIYIEELARHIRLSLGEIGVSVSVTPLPDTINEMRIKQNDFQISLDSFVYYPMDVLRTFYDFFNLNNAEIKRNRFGGYDAEAVRQLRRASRVPNQTNAKAIFHRLQDLYKDAFTTNVLSYQHHRIFAINSRIVTNFMRDNRLLPIALWIPFINP